MIRNYFTYFSENLYALNIFLSFLIIFYTSFYFPELNYFSIFLIFLSINFYLLKDILKFSNLLYKFFTLSLFIKLFFLHYIYTLGYDLGYVYGDIGGSDTLTYFHNSKIFLDFYHDPDFFFPVINKELVSIAFFKDASFLSYNAILRYLIPEITLEQISSFNIFLSTFSSIYFFRILTHLNVDKKIIIIATILSLIDLKLLFFSLFNLKETLINYLIIFISYRAILIKYDTNYLRKFKSIFVILFVFLLIFLFREYVAVSLLIVFSSYIFLQIFKFKINLILTTLFSFVLMSTLYVFFLYLYGDTYLVLKETLITYTENSIGSRITNLDITDNPINFLIHLSSGIIGIFPLFEFYTHYMELEKISLIFFHLLLILSIFGFIKIINNNLIDKKTLILFLFVLLILFFSTLGSFGTSPFIRYSVHLNYALIYFAAFYLEKNIWIKVRQSILIYLVLQVLLIILYHLIKIFINL